MQGTGHAGRGGAGQVECGVVGSGGAGQGEGWLGLRGVNLGRIGQVWLCNCLGDWYQLHRVTRARGAGTSSVAPVRRSAHEARGAIGGRQALINQWIDETNNRRITEPMSPGPWRVSSNPKPTLCGLGYVGVLTKTEL